MFRWIINLFRPAHGFSIPPRPECKRSPKWPAVRADHLKAHPTCAACGTRDRLEVHHIYPFAWPGGADLELSASNLLTLCEVCHFSEGHLCDWKSMNHHVISDAAEKFDKVKTRAYPMPHAGRMVLPFLWAAVLWLVGGSLSPAQPSLKEPAADIAGYYVCEGDDGGKRYRGMAQIERKGDIYLVSWMMGNPMAGIGVRVGDNLSVAWAVAGEKGIVRGVNVYRIGAKTLEGRWATLPGNGRVSSETLTFMKELPASDE